MNFGDTIIACSTGASHAPRALVRLSGPDVARLASVIAGDVPPRTAARGLVRWRDGAGAAGERALPVLCVCFAAPASYTGEDMLELSLPGNPALVERVIDAIMAAAGAGAASGGVRRAEPGEFSARAFLRGKLTLEQAEGVAGVIAARTTEQLAAAERLRRGATGDRYRAWLDELATLLALVEAGIDFTDQEDVVAIAPAELARRAREVEAALARELGPTRAVAAPGALPVVLIVGEPNAGKSTLFNALLGARRAVESDERGTTRDVLCEELDLGTHVPGAGRVMLCDSAGIDELVANGPSESAAQSATRAAIADADVIVWCDPSGEFGRDASQGIGHQASGIGESGDVHATSSPGVREGVSEGAGHQSSGIRESTPSPALGARVGAIDMRPGAPIIRVRTKSDCATDRHVLSSSSPTAMEGVSEGAGHQSSGISESTPSPALGARQGEPAINSPTAIEGATSSWPPDTSPSRVIPVCALDAWNLNALRRAIADAAGVGGSEGLALARHAAALRAARIAMARLPGDIDPAARALAHPETIAESLREAIDHLGAIGGRLTTEDILGKVFSAFCVGK